MSSEFSIKLAKQLVESEEQFPINLHDAIIWLGYTRKDSAKEKLVRNFEKRIDYSVTWRNVPHSQGFGASRVEALKSILDLD